jgi:hypothetical protein
VSRSGTLKLTKALGTTVIVSVGVQVDNASELDIQKFGSLFDQLIEELTQAMGDKWEKDVVKRIVRIRLRMASGSILCRGLKS